MKKILFFTALFVFTGLLACREQASQHKDGDGHEHKDGDGHEHKDGDTKHEDHEHTPGEEHKH